MSNPHENSFGNQHEDAIAQIIRESGIDGLLAITARVCRDMAVEAAEAGEHEEQAIWISAAKDFEEYRSLSGSRG